MQAKHTNDLWKPKIQLCPVAKYLLDKPSKLGTHYTNFLTNGLIADRNCKPVLSTANEKLVCF